MNAERRPSQPSAESVVDLIKSGENYKSVFEHSLRQYGPDKRFRNTIERARNPQVSTQASLVEVRLLEVFINHGVPGTQELRMDVLDSLYVVDRSALIRVIYGFMRVNTGGIILKDLEQERKAAVKGLPKRLQDLHLSYADDIIDEAILGRKFKAV